MSERVDADKLARKLLNEPYADPDDDLRMLSRQLLRRKEVIGRLEKALIAQQDPTADLVNANRDVILRITEEGLRKVAFQLHYIVGSMEQSPNAVIPPIVIKDLIEHGRLAERIVEAVNTFHPMHSESWCGWPTSME